MRKIVTLALFFLVLTVGLGGCDLLDSSNVENPALLEEEAFQVPNPLENWVNGLDRQMLIVLNSTVDYTSIATDNYVNTETFYNQQADRLDFNNQDTDINGMYFDQNDLRESALYAKNEILNETDNPNPDDIAEADFYLGMAHLFLGETFRSAPLENRGQPASPSDHFEEAREAFQNAIEGTTNDEVATGYKLAQARAYYNNGNITEARNRAEEVLSEDPSYLRLAEFDNENGPANTMQNALYDRSSLDDFQPLPRLDFLDPKFGESGANETPFPLLKAEEAHLILIEADLAEGNIGSAQDQMKDLIALVEDERDVRSVDETGEGRRHVSPEGTPRPNGSEYQVAFSLADAQAGNFRSGLVLDRTEETEVPSVSGTHVTEAMVDNISNEDEAWELYYLMRQEIFLAEGRRFFTLGLQLPLPLEEAQLNDNIEQGSEPMQGFIPGYVDNQRVDGQLALDLWVPIPTDAAITETNRAAALVDMNQVLAENRSSVSPFL